MVVERPPLADRASAPAGELLVQLTGLTKTYGAVQALRGADFDLRRGEVHALLGQNGAGKSTLIKLLSGVEQPTGGRIRLLGEDVSFASPHESQQAGIAVVYQELSLVPSMSVVDNLFLGREPRRALLAVDRRAMLREARAFLDRFDFPLDLKALVEDLPFAYRQMTEIAKALMGDVRVLILDEPTSALSDQEEGVLFDAVRRVVSEGVGVIYVTHRLREVADICDRVTVFRDGRNVGTSDTSSTDMKTLVARIVGSQNAEALLAVNSAETPVAQDAVPAPAALSDEPFLELDDVRNDVLAGVTLLARPGEIVGLAGVVGTGRTEVLETIFGLRGVRSGRLRIGGSDRTLKSPVDAIKLGIGLLPEDRHGEGLVLSHSIESNFAMPVLARLSRQGVFRKRASKRRSVSLIKELSVKATGPGVPVGTLSGGNQQKVVFGRWAEPRCSLLLLDEPTVGVDVGAREEIYGAIRRAAEAGTSVLVVSSDLDELMLLCTRIYVMQNGRIAAASVDRADLQSSEELHHLTVRA